MAVSILLNAVETTGASSAVDTARARVKVTVKSATTSTATVKIQESLDNALWLDSVTITNPAAAGVGYEKALGWPYTRVNVTARADGAITATIDVER